MTLAISAFSQGRDYKIDRKQITSLSCGPVDSIQLADTRKSLENVDTTTISENIHLYYKDLGWCYYRFYLKYNQIYFLEMSVIAYEKCIAHQPDYGPALWDLAFEYAHLKNCEKSKKHLDKYLKIRAKEFQQKEDQIISLRNKCL